jgi:hypothetical protein
MNGEAHPILGKAKTVMELASNRIKIKLKQNDSKKLKQISLKRQVVEGSLDCRAPRIYEHICVNTILATYGANRTSCVNCFWVRMQWYVLQNGVNAWFRSSRYKVGIRLLQILPLQNGALGFFHNNERRYCQNDYFFGKTVLTLLLSASEASPPLLNDIDRLLSPSGGDDSSSNASDIIGISITYWKINTS